MFKTTLACAATGLMLAAAPASAAPRDGEAMQIEYRDLDLSTPEGQGRLDRRIDQAARKVCKVGETRTGTRVPSNERNKCFAQARAAAKAQMAAIAEEQQRGG